MTDLASWSIFRDEKHTIPEPVQGPWVERAPRLFGEVSIRDTKSGPAWSPTQYAEGASRGNGGVVAISAMVLDFDHGADPEAIRHHLERLGLEAWIHSTHSSTPESPRFRVVVPLAEPVLAAEWPAIWPRSRAYLDPEGRSDSTTSDPARIYYMPSAKPGAPSFSYRIPGRPLRTEDLPPAPTTPRREPLTRPGEIVPILEGERHVRLVSIAGRLRRAGASPESIRVELSLVNETRCSPPVPASEVEEIARSMGRYEPAPQVETTAPLAVAKSKREAPEESSSAEIAEFKAARLRGVPETEALAAVGEGAREALRKRGLLEEWPVGWTDEESASLAQYLSFDDVIARLTRVVDLPREKLVIGVLLAAQGHLAPILRAMGSAIHGIPVNARYSAGKTRCAHALTILGGGQWVDSATIPYLKSVRKDAPVVVGLDEGDEAERDNPGIKAYLLISHSWDAVYGKFTDPNAKGRRELEEIRYGGPVFVTFRKKPWPALQSRAIVFDIEPSTRSSVSDDGAGDALRRLLLAPSLWLKRKCEEGLERWDADRALVRIKDPAFLKTLDRVTRGLPVLRQRDKARSLLFMGERIGIDLATEIEAALREEEVESENATVIEAIERDPEFQAARESGGAVEVAVEPLRLRVQRDLRENREPCDLNRNRFGAVLKEMGFSRQKGPTWKLGKGRDRRTVILPGLWDAQGLSAFSRLSTPSREEGESGETGETPHGPTPGTGGPSEEGPRGPGPARDRERRLS